MSHPYLPNTPEDVRSMLDVIGAQKVEDLFSSIPANVKLDKALNLPPAASELEVRRQLAQMAGKNLSADELTCFLGAGSYDHYIPSVVRHISGRSEFYTAYTPYQPEISQGTLQSVFEYQSMMCMLTGMDVTNVSMYDGPTAAAEALMLASSAQKRKKVLISKTVHPEILKVAESYLIPRNVEVVLLEEDKGVTSIASLKEHLSKDVAAVMVQYPNFYGILEDFSEVEQLTHAEKALFLMSTDPFALGVLKTPADWGADIVTGEGQSLGQNMNFGGPVLGFMSIREKLVRKMPGRIVGQSVDKNGKRAFVLTLQAREQHIRREKATSNICSDQTLNSITAAIYMATMGQEGLEEAAQQCLQKSHYAYKELVKTGKFRPVNDAPFFREFVLETDLDVDKMNEYLLEKGILGGLSLEKYGKKGQVLFCVTESRSKDEIDRLVKLLEVM